MAMIAVVILALAFVAYLRRGGRRGSGADADGVLGYVGPWGSGKTLALVRDGLWALRDPKCRAVYATFHLRDQLSGREAVYLEPDHLIEQLTAIVVEVEEVRQGFYVCILLDELNVLMPSRLWASLPVSMLFRWSHGRKLGWRVRWSAQSERRVDAVVREVTNYIVRCRRGLCGIFYRHDFYLPEDTGGSTEAQKKKRARSALVRPRTEWFRSYDTLEAVQPAEHLVRGRRRPSPSLPPPVASREDAA
jgi:hypothetical protein